MKKRWMAILTASCLMLSSCGLLPEEQTYQSAPVVRNVGTKAYTEVVCARGDIRLTGKVSCEYVPVRTETLSFTVGGIAYEEALVSVGEQVHAGDVLVRLDQRDIQKQMDSTRRQIRNIELRMAQLEEQRTLAHRHLEIQGRDFGDAAQALDAQYDAQKLSLTDSRDMAQLRLEDCEYKLELRTLRAPIDGTVTYLRKITADTVSSIGSSVVTVADSTMSIFRAKTDMWQYFTVGDVVTIISNRVEYEAVVTAPEALGVSADIPKETEKKYVYFTLSEPALELEGGDKGTITLLFDSREDVLWIPSKAIHQINEQSVVYYQNENGIRTIKYIDVGLTADGKAEVLSGLEEGEAVILQ